MKTKSTDAIPETGVSLSRYHMTCQQNSNLSTPCGSKLNYIFKFEKFTPILLVRSLLTQKVCETLV